jgi:hypothetical protein
MGFFNLYKPREYGYRYIYYDPKKEEAKAKQKAQEQAKAMNATADEPYKPTLQRGVFRAMADKNKNFRVEQMRKSNIRLGIILVVMFALMYYILS